MTPVDTAPRAQRLPPGRHKLPRELVRENQRQRLIGAATETLVEHGYGAITVTGVTSAAGVSTGTLYKRFEGLWDCLLASYETGADRLCEEIELACAAAGSGDEAARAAIARGLALLDAEPALAHLLCAAPPTHAIALGEARVRLAERLAALLRGVRGDAGPGRSDLPLIAGAMALVSMRLRSGDARLGDLSPTLTEILLGP